MLKDVTDSLPVLPDSKRPITDDSEQLPKRRRSLSKSVLETQALENHAHAIEQNQKGIAGLQCGFFYMRTPKTPEKKTPTKYAVRATGPIDEMQFETDLSETNQFRPCIPDAHSPGGSVVSVKTPNGTKLPLTLDLGVIRVFSNAKTAAKRDEINPGLISTDNSVVTPPRATSKTQHLRLSENDHYRSSEKRKRGQNDIMHRKGTSVKEASATKVAQRAGIAMDAERFEWLHLICHRMKGELGQNKENLVAGTFHANTLMIPVEAHLPHLKKYLHSEVSLHVSAELIPNTHIARTIHYIIRIEQPEGLPAKEIAFKFDALLATAPSRCIKKVVDIYMLNLLEREQLEQYAIDLALERISAQFAEEMDLDTSSSEEDDVRRTLDFSSESSETLFTDDDESPLFPRRLDFSDESSEASSSKNDALTLDIEFQALFADIEDLKFISVDSAMSLGSPRLSL